MLNFREALEWLTTSLTFGINPGLERVIWLLEQLGNPQDDLKAIHVVGTNGKGSTVNYLRQIFETAGYQVGTFTSPSIMDFRERIAINGQMIDQDDFVAAVQLLQPVAQRLEEETDFGPATEFELITIMMFLYFSRLRPVDVVVIEAGLGGRYDSTNVFKPLAVICTSIGLDHQNFLGDSHLQIASEKVGVLKPGVPFVFAEGREDVRQLFYQEAQRLACPTYEAGRDFSLSGPAGHLTFRGDFGEIAELALAMPGQHQVSNASLAIMTSQLLKEAYPKLNPEGIRTALARSYWQGRTELIRPNLMLDGAHNDESVAVLVEVLKSYHADKTIHILFAAIKTKPAQTMLDQLQAVGQVTVTTFADDRAYALADYPDQLAKVARFEDWLTQVDQAGPEDFFVITGSLYFIGQVRRFLVGQATQEILS